MDHTAARMDAFAPPRGGQPADGDLVARAGRGDAVAFEELVRARVDALFRTACAITGNEADARDATQDAFISAWRSLPSLREPEKFDAWLGRILVNACRQILRRRGRVRDVSIDVAASLADPRASAEGTELRAVLAAFDRLSIDERTLLTLHHLQHRPVAEIAGTLGIPVGTVKWRLHQARGALQRAIEADR